MQHRICWAMRLCGRRALALAGLALALIVVLTACEVSLGPGSSGVARGQGVTVPIRVISGPQGATLVLLPVSINGQGPFTFALDTGASSSIIDTPVARRLGLPQTGSPTPVAGISGQSQSVPVQIKRWHIEQINLPSMTVGSINLFDSQRGQGLQGLIGSDIWNQFGRISINYSDQTLTVPKQIAGASGSSARNAPPTHPSIAELRRILAA